MPQSRAHEQGDLQTALCQAFARGEIGDVIAVRKWQVTYSSTRCVIDSVSSRQPAKNVPLYCLKRYPAVSELDKLNVPRETIFHRPRPRYGPSDQEGAARTGRADGGDHYDEGGIKGESRRRQSRLFPEALEEKKKASCRVFSANRQLAQKTKVGGAESRHLRLLRPCT